MVVRRSTYLVEVYPKFRSKVIYNVDEGSSVCRSGELDAIACD
jgi:hypothetical protein